MQYRKVTIEVRRDELRPGNIIVDADDGDTYLVEDVRPRTPVHKGGTDLELTLTWRDQEAAEKITFLYRTHGAEVVNRLVRVDRVHD